MKIGNTTADRRSFLKGAGITGVGMAAATLVGVGEPKAMAATVNDADILNFALNLEFLEAEFYATSTYGATLVELGVISESDTTGPTTGWDAISGFAQSNAAFLATALRDDEITHVKYLMSALGSGAVKKPAINLGALGYGFDSVNSWLKLARQLEDVGVSAYLGAAGLITSKTYLGAAAAILATEAQHSGSIRVIDVWNGVTSPAVDGMDVPPTPNTPYCVDSNALSISRTTSQVLNIVYAGGQSSGGFYPQGMNGTINSQ